MTFMPFQSIQPVANTVPSPGAGSQVMGQPNEGNPKFENFLEQALGGVNDSIWNAAGLFQKAMVGQVKNLHEVTIASAEADVLLKLATGVTSKITTAASSLFQMQF